MAHMIDESTGKAAVFVARKPAWHKLGTVVADAQTSAEAIKLAGLDWEVWQWSMKAFGPDGQVSAVNSRVANVRSDTGAVIGIVGHGYRVLQNRDAFQFMDDLVGEQLAMFESAGALAGGARIWMLAKLPKELRAGKGNDVVESYVLLANSHDGSLAVHLKPTTVRVVCQNTLTLALAGSRGMGLTIKHSESLAGRIEEARQKLGIVVKRLDRFQEQLDALAAVSLKGSEVKAYWQGFFPTTPTKRANGHANGVSEAAVLEQILGGQAVNQDVVQELLAGDREVTERTAKRNAEILQQILRNYEADPARGTAWGAYNALSEWVDHQMPVRGAQDNRLASIWWGRGDEIKQAAFKAALGLAS